MNNPFDVVSWIWIFGDGTSDNSSSSLNISHLYNSTLPENGIFYIDLIISSGNCSDTISDSIFIANPVAEFTPVDYVCINGMAVFENLSTGSNEWSWDFGDGSSNSNNFNPSHQYGTSGIVTVTLISSYDGITNCEDTYTSTLQVLDPVLDMFFINNPMCRGSSQPFQVTTNQDVYNWSLSFYNGASPITGTGPISDSYTYPTDVASIEGGAIVTVQYSSVDSLCPSTFTFPVTFFDVVADFYSPDQPDFIICKGEFINLVDTSTNADIISWTFGNGATSTVGNVIQVYPNAGSYPITLNIESFAYGCEDRH